MTRTAYLASHFKLGLSKLNVEGIPYRHLSFQSRDQALQLISPGPGCTCTGSWLCVRNTGLSRSFPKLFGHSYSLHGRSILWEIHYVYDSGRNVAFDEWCSNSNVPMVCQRAFCSNCSILQWCPCGMFVLNHVPSSSVQEEFCTQSLQHQIHNIHGRVS